MIFLHLQAGPFNRYKVHFVFCVAFPCVTNADCRLAYWQVSKVNIVVKCSNRFPINKIDFNKT